MKETHSKGTPPPPPNKQEQSILAHRTTTLIYLLLGELAVAVQVPKLKDFFEAQLAVGVGALVIPGSSWLALLGVRPQTRGLGERHKMLAAHLFIY